MTPLTLNPAMSRFTLLALLLLVTVTVGNAAAAVPQLPTRAVEALLNTRGPVPCKTSAKRAVIGGRVRCLRIGLRCELRFNTAKPTYTHYGFFCGRRTSDDPLTLFRVAQPGFAPTTCPGLGPAPPPSNAPGFLAVGAQPFYVGPYLERDPNMTIWRNPKPALLGSDGWAAKFLWYVAAEAVPARVSITDLDTGQPIVIVVHGEARSRAPLLEPNTAMEFPDHTWGSYVVFPRAGCYRLDAQWQGGSWSLVFSFGR
jgi:hypothetical protein